MNRQVKADLERIGVLRRGDRIGVEAVFDIPVRVRALRSRAPEGGGRGQSLPQEPGILSVGRYGGWEYSSMEDAIWAARRC